MAWPPATYPTGLPGESHLNAELWSADAEAEITALRTRVIDLEGDVAARVPFFQPFTNYIAGDPIVNPGGELVRAVATFTSGEAFVEADWTAPPSSTYATIVNLGVAASAAAAAQTTADEAAAGVAAATRGDIIYTWTGSAYVLAAGQLDDGVSPRSYRGGASGAPEAQPGHVARAGDWHLAV